MKGVQCTNNIVGENSLSKSGHKIEKRISNPKFLHLLEQVSITIYCGINCDILTIYEDSFQFHRTRSPKCPLMSLELLQSRITTFVSWEKATNFTPSISSEELAKAGFFLNCKDEEDKDVVTCFQYGVTLGNWEPDDCATKEHSKRNPLCHFLLYGRRGGNENCYYEFFLSGIPCRIICENSIAQPENKIEIQQNEKCLSDIDKKRKNKWNSQKESKKKKRMQNLKENEEIQEVERDNEVQPIKIIMNRIVSRDAVEKEFEAIKEANVDKNDTIIKNELIILETESENDELLNENSSINEGKLENGIDAKVIEQLNMDNKKILKNELIKTKPFAVQLQQNDTKAIAKKQPIENSSDEFKTSVPKQKKLKNNSQIPDENQ